MNEVTWRRLTRPIVGRIASIVSRGTLRVVEFGRAIPRVQVSLQSDEVRQDIPFLQPQGFSSHPVAGREVLAVCLGGMRAAAHVIMVIDDKDRPTDQVPGEAEIYAPGGARVVCRLNGSVEVFAPGGVTVHGDATVDGNVTATGDTSDDTGSIQEMRAIFDAHTHPQYSPGRTTHPTLTPMGGD